jgi:hypothetical protein
MKTQIKFKNGIKMSRQMMMNMYLDLSNLEEEEFVDITYLNRALKASGENLDIPKRRLLNLLADLDALANKLHAAGDIFRASRLGGFYAFLLEESIELTRSRPSYEARAFGVATENETG